MAAEKVGRLRGPVIARSDYILYTSGHDRQPKGVVRDNGGHYVRADMVGCSISPMASTRRKVVVGL